MSLPLVDFTADPNPSDSITAGLARFGFLQLANIGIDPAELETVFRESAAFFDGPAEAKRRCGYRSSAENFGYQGLLEENLDPNAPADLKQTFTMRDIVRRPPPPERWPSERFRDVMTRFYAEALAAAHAIQRAMARSFDLPEDYFVRVHSGETVTLRLLHYPAGTVAEAGAAQLGAGAHTDYGFFTLLFQHSVGGLQVIDDAGDWIDVPPRDDVVVVNSGDLLEHWSNGRFKSTTHRVKANTGDRDRLSIAMFLDPDSDTLVDALPGCVSAQNPARYAPITAGEHLRAKLDASHKGRFTS